MNKTSLLIILILSICYSTISSQTQPSSEVRNNVDRANYLEDDLDRFLEKHTNYPREAVEKELQGDVIISITISENGQLDSMAIVRSTNNIFTMNSIVSLNELSNKWSPCMVDGKPTKMEYLCVFRYRLYLNTSPPDYKLKAGKLIAKEKYNKAITVYDGAILDNPYDYNHYLTRSKLKEIYGDQEGAKYDYEKSQSLQNEVISLTDVVLVGRTRSR